MGAYWHRLVRRIRHQGTFWIVFIAPWKKVALTAVSGGIFPFFLGRQTICDTVLFRTPVNKGFYVVHVDESYWSLLKSRSGFTDDPVIRNGLISRFVNKGIIF